MDILADYLLKKKDNPKMFSVKTIISGAEALPEKTRNKLKQVFGVCPVSGYSNQENGVLAQELLGTKKFKLNIASYYFEFLKVNSDEKAEYGELARVVVTDLFNYATPIIRYDTGDLAVVEQDSVHGDVIISIEGRKRDFIYDTSGNLVSPGTITVNMWKFNKVKQFQFIQEDKTLYTLKLNGSKEHYDDQEYVQLFRRLLGQDATIIVEHVDGIPRLSSGKFRAVVCNYTPHKTE